MDIDRNWDAELLAAARTAVDEIEWLGIAQEIRKKVLNDMPNPGARGQGSGVNSGSFLTPHPSPLTPCEEGAL